MQDRVTEVAVSGPSAAYNTTYAYGDDGGSPSYEERGLPTTITDSVGGAFSATYDADGNLASETYPGAGGLMATYTYDPAGDATSLAYSSTGTNSWPDSSADYNIHGEKTMMTSDLWAYNYAYNRAGMLTKTNELNTYDCVTRNYGYDADSNLYTLDTGLGNASNCSDSDDLNDETYGHDEADRNDTSGYVYDTLGRATTVPGQDAPNGDDTTVGYYTNDLVNTIASGGTTTTYTIDPDERDDTFTSSGQTDTEYYTGDGDTPSLITSDTSGTTWARYIEASNGVAATINQAGTVNLKLTNLHGDVIAQAAPTDTSWNTSAAQTETNEYGLTSSGSVNRYDYLGSDLANATPVASSSWAHASTTPKLAASSNPTPCSVAAQITTTTAVQILSTAEI